MLRLSAGKAIRAQQMLSSFAQMYGGKGANINNSDFNRLFNCVDDLASMADQLGMQVSLVSIRQLRDLLDDVKRASVVGAQSQDIALLPNLLISVLSRFPDEIDSHIILHIPFQKSELFYNNSRISKNVVERYPDAVIYIQEAMNCYCLERYTACVFHSMRAVEVGLRATGKALGLNLAHSNWGTLIDLVKTEIRDRNRSGDVGWPERRAMFQDVCASLQAMKDAWRNPTMHVERQYSENEAEHIMRVAMAFMDNVSGAFDQDGKAV